MEILLEHKKGMEDKNGNTASAYTLMNKYTSIAMFLREHEAPSRTPFHVCIFHWRNWQGGEVPF